MNPRPIFAAALAVLVAGCAVAPRTAGELAVANQVKVYAPAQLKQGQYDTIRRLWIDTRHGQTWVPEYASAEDGIIGLQLEAARLGANGLVNVACYKDEKGQFPTAWTYRPAFICHGNAIRVRASGG